MGALLASAAASANDSPVTLQWFELRWSDMEHRAPDFFMAGYGAVWLPPASKGSATGSVGYDVFDRFNLGRPGDETVYGTESDFRAVLGELHAANAQVTVDAIMNHCAFRQEALAFHQKGGWPGFWTNSEALARDKRPTDDWGDFHAGTSGGYYQSEDPGGARYDLYRGDLVALVDIAQETNHQLIRQPVADGDPWNIPAGSVYNKPSPANARFYPDRSLTPFTFTNPGTSRNPGSKQWTLHPFNTAEPLAGDAVTDNTTGQLMRWTQWMMDEFGVDGFRLDAAKHIPTWFWDTYWDTAVHQRRVTPAGTKATPFSYVESVADKSWTYANYVRRDAFGNRDALDLNGAGELRNLVSSGGFGSWQNVLSAHMDTADDGQNNGTLGVNHVFSHDNGSAGDGGSPPPTPTLRQQGPTEHAYMLMRAGPAIVYHNARGVSRPGGFWPRQGSTLALGVDTASGSPSATITSLLAAHAACARGEFNVLNGTFSGDKSASDVLVFERRRNQGGGGYLANCLVGVNDRYDAGWQERSVLTSFPSGTRLHELTGNAADDMVDPGGSIPSLLVVGADRRVTIRVPNNASTAGEHSRGYVVYAPALPSGTLVVTGATSEIAADPGGAPSYRRRSTVVPVIPGDSFQVRLTTTQTDPGDPETDDNAVFRIDQGFADWNGNGQVDIGEGGVVPGYEQFVTVREPLWGSASSEGRYYQSIDATRLPEGYHYISVAAFRHREGDADPLFREFRQVVYVDRLGPAHTLLDAADPITEDTWTFRVRFDDRTGRRMHLMVDLPGGVDPVAAADTFNQGSRHDRFEWRRTEAGLTPGLHEITTVVFEDSGNASVEHWEVFVDTCRADFNRDGKLNINDFIAFQAAWRARDARADWDGGGTFTVNDFIRFQADFAKGCG